MKSINGQIDMFSYMNNTTYEDMAEKPYEKGTLLYEVKLDKYQCYIIEGWFEHSGKGKYGYHAARVNSPYGGTTIQHCDIGENVFLTEKDAIEKAVKNASGLIKLSEEELNNSILDIRSFVKFSLRIQNPRCQFKTIALLKQGIYIKDDCDYPFLHIYKDTNASKNTFDRICFKSLKNNFNNGMHIEEIQTHFSFEDVYRCTESKYSSLVYTCNHGSPYGDESKYDYGNLISKASI